MKLKKDTVCRFCKYHKRENNMIEKEIHITREYEKEIEIIPYITTKEELNNLCGVDFFEDRYLLNILVTERRNYICEDNIISLDRNSYLGITDYELEIEYKNKIIEKIKKKLEQEKIYNEKNYKLETAIFPKLCKVPWYIVSGNLYDIDMKYVNC